MSGPGSTEIVRFRPSSGRCRLDGPKSANLDQIGPVSARFGQTRANIDQGWPTLAKVTNKLAKFDTISPIFGRLGFKVFCRPRPTHMIGQDAGARLGRALPNAGQLWPASARIGSESDNFGRNWAEPRLLEQVLDLCDHGIGLNRRNSGGARRSPFDGGPLGGGPCAHLRARSMRVRGRSGPGTGGGENRPRREI